MSPGATDPLGARCLILTRWTAGITWTRWTAGITWTAGIRGRGARCPGDAGFEGAGEGRSEVGRWQGGITEPVKKIYRFVFLFFKITGNMDA